MKKILLTLSSCLLIALATTAQSSSEQIKEKKVVGHMSTQVIGKHKNVGTDITATVTEGIILFDRTGCERCTYAGNFMVKNKIPFTVLNISDPINEDLMYELLRKQGYGGKRFRTPAILVDGEISYSHKNLEKFMWKLVK